MSSKVIQQTIFNGDKSVDTFFMVGGLLVAYGMLNQMEKTNKFKPVYFYVHRIVRYTNKNVFIIKNILQLFFQ